MQTPLFNDIVEARLQSIKTVLQQKALEYSKGNEDRLHNFNTAAQITGHTREKALWGMAMKHLVSVIDMIESWDSKHVLPSEYLVNEKIGDLINYLILLEACFKERIEKHGDKHSVVLS